MRQMAALRFYIRRIIREVTDQWSKWARGATNYRALLDRIESWRVRTSERVLLVTFNYDTLLEDAASDVLGFRLDGIDAYIASEEYKIFKAHGSVDWGRFIASGLTPRRSDRPSVEAQIINEAANLTLSDDYIWLGRSSDHMRYDRPLLPALAIPTLTKSGFECPPSHIETLAELLPEVKRMLVIGWRATEKHFVDDVLRGRVKNPIRVVAVVNGGTEMARDAANRIEGATELPSDRFMATELGFSSLLNRKEIAEEVLGAVLAPD